MKGDDTPIPCTAAYQKWIGQPVHPAGSKNPLPLGMGSVKRAGADIENLEYDGEKEIVRIEAEKWHKDVNVMADSGIALIRDVCKKL